MTGPRLRPGHGSAVPAPAALQDGEGHEALPAESEGAGRYRTWQHIRVIADTKPPAPENEDATPPGVLIRRRATVEDNATRGKDPSGFQAKTKPWRAPSKGVADSS